MTFTVEYEREEDGRWLAEVLELPGVLAYGANSDEAIAKAQALALRVLADRLEHGVGKPEFISISFAAASANGRQLKLSAFSPRLCE
jgi:predicted RNase H-like HicB family nuclease